MNKPAFKKQNIAMVSDYFYPSIGGVESHIKILSEELSNLGHNIIVITHKYKNYVGVHKIGKLTVYYLDLPIIAGNTTLPTLFFNFIIYKEIFEKHKITIVHGHQTMSTMCLEAIFHANFLGYKTVLTDHSVFEFSKFERVICDSLVYLICRNLSKAICVSKIAKLNTQKRILVPEGNIVVIPNGINPLNFYPKKKSDGKKFNLIFSSRLVFRKGIDLLIDAIPLICKDKRFNIIIIGDGPKRDEIEQVIDENDLQDRVKLIGEKSYNEIPEYLRMGDIFLNTSLTETFCIAILEAASCGLQLVSTNVGGIHEILPEGTIYFCKPDPEDIALQVITAANNFKSHDPLSCFEIIKQKYNWKTIALSTAKVYESLEDKAHGFSDFYKQFPLRNQFLYRIAVWFEFLLIKLAVLFESK